MPDHLPSGRVLSLLFLVALAATPAGALDGAPVSTDHADYAPGSTVLLAGRGFAPFEPVTLDVVGEGAPAWRTTLDVIADADGSFDAPVTIAPWFIANYAVT